MERRLTIGIGLLLGAVLVFATMRLAALGTTVERLSNHIERLEGSLASGAGPATVVCPSARESLTASDLRSVASTCAQALGGASAAETSASAEADEAAPEQLALSAQAVAESNAVIDRAKARGVWSQADQVALNDALSQLPREEIGAVMLRLTSALNARELARR
jgi:hypothetical protein